MALKSFETFINCRVTDAHVERSNKKQNEDMKIEFYMNLAGLYLHLNNFPTFL